MSVVLSVTEADSYRPDTYWARQKLMRAKAHLRALNRSVRPWVYPVRHPLEIRLEDDGYGLGAWFRLRQAPPLDRWSLLVGDCAHNLRTALDVFVWANSVILPESDRGFVAYPILSALEEDDEDAYNDGHISGGLEEEPRRVRDLVERRLAGLPPALRERVKENLRFAHRRLEGGDLIEHDLLPLVAELDNIDKHRLALSLEPTWSQIQWNLRLYDEQGQHIKEKVEWSHERLPSNPSRFVRVAWTEVDTRIARVRGDAWLSLELCMPFRPGYAPRIPRLLRSLHKSTEGLLDYLEEPYDSPPGSPPPRQERSN